MKHFPISYTWADADGEYQGHTVASGPDEAAALAAFQRRNAHLTDAWITGSRPVQLPPTHKQLEMSHG